MNINQVADAMRNRDVVEVFDDGMWQAGSIQRYEVAGINFRAVSVMFTDPRTSVRCVELRGSEIETRLRPRGAGEDFGTAVARALGGHLPNGLVTLASVVRGIENLIAHSGKLADELNGPAGFRARLAARTTDLAAAEKLANAQADRMVSLRETQTTLTSQLAEARRACENLREERDKAVANSADEYRKAIYLKANALGSMPAKDITIDVLFRHIEALKRLAGS